MGCDIHMIVQKRETPDAPWATVAVSYECNYCGGVGKREYPRWPGEQRDCLWCRGKGQLDRFHDRNYDLFGQLANVRNGRGFAGCDLGDGFIPISEPRGLPDGVAEWPNGEPGDDEDYTHETRPWLGDHSHSWLLLSELLAYDLDRKTVCRGVVDREAWQKWDRKGAPMAYCGGVSGAICSTVTDKEALHGVASTHVQVQWAESYRQAGGAFWSHFVPMLQKLGRPDCIRVVFGFDN